MLPFNKAKIFTVSLKLSTLTLTLFFGHHLLFRGRFSQNWRQINTTISIQLIKQDELRASPHQLNCKMPEQELKQFFWNSFWFKKNLLFFFWPCLVKTAYNKLRRIYWDYCSVEAGKLCFKEQKEGQRVHPVVEGPACAKSWVWSQHHKHTHTHPKTKSTTERDTCYLLPWHLLPGETDDKQYISCIKKL
jgi:hypothetical protein